MTEFEGLRVLVLEGYARQSLPVIKAFKELGCYVSVLCNSKLDLAYWSVFPDKKIIGTCNTEKYDETVDCVRELLKSGEFDVVFPLVDFSAKILSHNKEEFKKYVRVISNDAGVYDVAQDKLKVMQLCADNNIPCPKTVHCPKSYQDVLNEKLLFPIILKPRRECGARGIKCFETEEEFTQFVQKNNICLENYVVQEYIPQDLQNMSSNLFVDKSNSVKSNFVYASYRWFPIKGGTGTFNITVDEPLARKYSEKLVKIMKLQGCIGIDFIKDPRDNMVKVLEINPRIMACCQIGFLSGVNVIRQVLENEFCEDVTEMFDYKKDVRVRMTQTDVLWFLKSPERFHAKPSFFSNKNTYDQTFSWRDPFPWFAFFLQGLLKYQSEMSKRK